MPTEFVTPSGVTSPLFSATMPYQRSDIKAIQRKLDQKHADRGTWTIKFATFRAPVGCTKVQFERFKTRAISRWVNSLELEGWRLESAPRLGRQSHPAHEWTGDFAGRLQADQREYRLGAWFSMPRAKEIVIEVPVTDEPGAAA